MRFKTKNFELKKKLLQAVRTKLKEHTASEYKDLFFKADLTNNQRAEAFARRESRRNANGQGAKKKDGSASNATESGGGEPFQAPQEK